ncbi:hypothetical protein [Anaerovorax sp. IOR16]|uniref:hypothetical protein n=1 Tax=Anaerovorax sp. IOR16 TaxID=2773458 RepID=UPI0019D1611C|nr:hypothetical protein [Anaerovorax sp. IOR16]
MSEKYPDLPEATFPESVAVIKQKREPKTEELPAIQQYYSYINSGNLVGAYTVLENNPSLKDVVFDAKSYNKQSQEIIALQRYFDEIAKIINLVNNLNQTITGSALDAVQGKILNDKIGDLTTLQTTDKSSVVGATNEVHSKLWNPNLLDNADFRIEEVIVNQKGIASGWIAPTSMYFIDRWRSYINIANNTTYTFEPNGLGVQVSEGYGGFIEMLEFPPTEGMYTFSAIIDGAVHSVTFDASTWSAQIGTNIGLTVLTYYDKKAARILFYDTIKHIIQRVKLEKGTVSTILNDPPQDYGEELRKCQRYFLRVNTRSLACGNISSSMDKRVSVPVITPVSMRANPTIIPYGSWRLFNGVNSAANPVASFPSSGIAYSTHIEFAVIATDTIASSQVWHLVQSEANNYIDFDANL